MTSHVLKQREATPESRRKTHNKNNI